MEQRIPRARLVGAIISLALSTTLVLAVAILMHQVKDFFDKVDVPLPGIVLNLIGVSDFLRAWWPAVLIALALEGLALAWSLRFGSLWLRIRTWLVILLVALFALSVLYLLQSLMHGIGKNK